MSSGHPEQIKWWRPWGRWDVELDLQEHEDKILLLLSLVVSAMVGLTIVAFVVSTEKLGSILVSAGGTQRFLNPLFGSLIGGWLLYRFFPEARGSGIPQTRVALVLRKGVIGLRTVIGKFICSSISLGSGVALGREGPSVHIGRNSVRRRPSPRPERGKHQIPHSRGHGRSRGGCFQHPARRRALHP